MINKQSLSSIRRHISNIPGYRTKRKLVVIESDDWGSIRMPDNGVFQKMGKQGFDFKADAGFRFNKFDSLASADDLSFLLELLNSIKDSTGRPVVITPVSVVANPDFDKISSNHFNEYFYEPFTRTLERYPGREKSFDLWKQGISDRLFVPQFHGREHLNVKPWLKALKNDHRNTRVAFENQMWGISTAGDPDIKVEFQAAFDFIEVEDLEYQKEVIKTGLDLFEKLFGYQASFFVPPNGPFSRKLEPVCADSGIKYLSTSKIQMEPQGNGQTQKVYHWLGQISKNKLTYLTRNCFFEPSDLGKDWVDSCLLEISSAFRMKKPAVISSHRVNYIGALHLYNRDNGLRQLNKLLKQIIKNWPECEFVTSEELGKIIADE